MYECFRLLFGITEYPLCKESKSYGTQRGQKYACGKIVLWRRAVVFSDQMSVYVHFSGYEWAGLYMMREICIKNRGFFGYLEDRDFLAHCMPRDPAVPALSEVQGLLLHAFLAQGTAPIVSLGNIFLWGPVVLPCCKPHECGDCATSVSGTGPGLSAVPGTRSKRSWHHSEDENVFRANKVCRISGRKSLSTSLSFSKSTYMLSANWIEYRFLNTNSLTLDKITNSVLRRVSPATFSESSHHKGRNWGSDLNLISQFRILGFR